VARRCGIIAGVGALGVMMVSCRKETDCDVYSSLSGSIGFWAWSSAAWASMRARSAGVIMIPTILNSVCRWGNGMLVRQKLVVPERDGVNFEVWPEAIELGRMFAAEGYELALVGGPVRDLLLHRKSS
jgi:hypothetical protein